MCPAEHLHKQAGWDGPLGPSRERLLSELSSEFYTFKVKCFIAQMLSSTRVHITIGYDTGPPSRCVVEPCKAEPD